MAKSKYLITWERSIGNPKNEKYKVMKSREYSGSIVDVRKIVAEWFLKYKMDTVNDTIVVATPDESFYAWAFVKYKNEIPTMYWVVWKGPGSKEGSYILYANGSIKATSKKH